MRLYAAGSYAATSTSPERFFVFVSSDGGSTWEPHEVALESDEHTLYLLAVDPVEPDRVFAWAKGDATDRLLVSEDGADSFETIQTIETMAVPSRGFGFAIGPDGTMYYGNSMGGLFSATSSADIRSLDRDLQVSCLALHDDELWVCANGRVNGFILGKSSLPDIAFEPVLTVEEVEGPRRSCGADSIIPARCDLCFEDLQMDFGLVPLDTTAAMRCVAGLPDAGVDGGLGLDGGATPDAGDGGGGGGGCCSAAGASRTASRGLLALAALALFAAAIRRRSRPRT